MIILCLRLLYYLMHEYVTWYIKCLNNYFDYNTIYPTQVYSMGPEPFGRGEGEYRQTGFIHEGNRDGCSRQGEMK